MKNPRFTKFVLFVNCTVPLAMLAWDKYRLQLGANPIAYVLHTLGMMGLVFLMLTLCVTPLRKLTGYNALSHYRRTLGLFAFFYIFLHLTVYFIYDRSHDLSLVLRDTWMRPFIFIGMTSFILMIPLALTSTNGSIKRMGAMKWKQLHRLTYVAAAGGVIHFYQSVKADHKRPLIFAGILGALLAIRGFYWARGAIKRAALQRAIAPAPRASVG